MEDDNPQTTPPQTCKIDKNDIDNIKFFEELSIFNNFINKSYNEWGKTSNDCHTKYFFLPS